MMTLLYLRHGLYTNVTWECIFTIHRRNNDVLAQSYGCKKIHFLALGMMDELVAGLRFEKRNIEIYVCKNLNCENFSLLYDFK